MTQKAEEVRIQADWPSVLLVNPYARKGQEQFDLWTQKLKEHLNLQQAFLPKTLEEFSSIINEAIHSGVRRIIIGGGDGTLSRAAELLAGSSVVMAILPLGTGNTLAGGLGIAARQEMWLQTATSGCIRLLDVGEALTKTHRRLFFNSATIGMSAQLAEMLTPEAKKRLGWMAWPMKTWHASRVTAPFKVQIDWENHQEYYETRQLIIAKGHALAGTFITLPGASSFDGLLHLFSLGKTSWTSSLHVGISLLLEKNLPPSAHYHALPAMSVYTDPPQKVDLDGDICMQTPVNFRVYRQALRVVLPCAKTVNDV
ncbi:MAG: diacylglycerol kinase family protein [Firmicutes bacterium]|nr:diacylglycerol kinase family protein [Bacillota bacterium]